MIVVYILIGTGALVAFPFVKKYIRNQKPLVIPPNWHGILVQRVRFFRELNEVGQQDFLEQVGRFLRNVPVNGVQVEITIADRLLVAASAVIPLFGFKGWEYGYLDEVIIYPSAFDQNFNFENPKELIVGMVGSGAMEGKMILSKPALHAGFDNTQDKQNVGIHEFIHLYDKEDGVIDGVPVSFMTDEHIMPWIDLVRVEMSKIHAGESGIRGYGGLNGKEFFAVAGEYFFERPHLLEDKHPELYMMLSMFFNQKMTHTLSAKEIKAKPLSRNSPCPCGSDNKYKHCCLGK
ncbi:zinc-dependent peptidase [Roseivirga sp.]|uniref:M90 family metallopeptidase n=1 Tax=Roseivirga sp. TaxID=1964215 RepID=UPI003B8AF032